MDSAATIVVRVGMDNKSDCSMLRKNVKFRKQFADKIGVGFELPDSISSSVVPNEPKTNGW